MSSRRSIAIVLVLAMSSTGVVAQGVPGSLETPEGTPRQHVVDSIHAEARRIVIDDTEYFLEGSVLINGQEVAPAAVVNILREGQRVRNLEAERDTEDGYFILREVNLF